MTQEKINRINELSRKSRTAELTEEEKAEQQLLREEYRASVRANFASTLDHTVIVRPDGTRVPVVRKPDATC